MAAPAQQRGACRVSRQPKGSALRAFQASPGSTAKIDPAKPPRPQSSRNTVLLHYCFNQQAGETKREWCPCKKRVSREEAFRLVKQGIADWLLVKNPKTSELVEFHRAVVVRTAVVHGKVLFAVTPPAKIDRRRKKHEAIKQVVRNRARKILQELVSTHVISQETFKMPDTELDELLQDEDKSKAFLQKLIQLGQARAREQMVKVMMHWWNNVLGYERLDVGAGKVIKDAARGKGELLYEQAIADIAAVQPDVGGAWD
jgi:hypothetical protein